MKFLFLFTHAIIVLASCFCKLCACSFFLNKGFISYLFEFCPSFFHYYLRMIERKFCLLSSANTASSVLAFHAIYRLLCSLNSVLPIAAYRKMPLYFCYNLNATANAILFFQNTVISVWLTPAHNHVRERCCSISIFTMTPLINCLPFLHASYAYLSFYVVYIRCLKTLATNSYCSFNF